MTNIKIVEYEEIKNKILKELSKFNKKDTKGLGGRMTFGIDSKYEVLDIEKTVCKSDIYKNNMISLKANFLFIIYPLYGNFSLINEYFLEDQRYRIDLPLFYELSIISNNDKYIK